MKLMDRRNPTCRHGLMTVVIVCLCSLNANVRAQTGIVIRIDPNRTFQEMDGFGASLTDSSARAIGALGDDQRHQLMQDLFDPNAGIGLSYLRQPMGTSDFRVEDYTYDDVPAGGTDYPLDRFSIERDRPWIIPLLKEAIAINPQIRIMGSPWSAPAWMKDSKRLEGGRLIGRYKVYDLYADYFVKYIQAYAAEGLRIDAVTLQNEPNYEPGDYPGMLMSPADQARLAICLGQKLQANKIDTKIVIWDHNWDKPDYPIEVLKDPQANPYIAGTAFHGYAGEPEAQLQVAQAYPDKAIYFTELSGGDWAANFDDNLMWDVGTLIIRAVRCHARTVIKWNLALDQAHGPKKSGGCGNCRGVVTIDTSTGAVTREEEYYALAHASKFVRPGARRIDSTEPPGGGVQNVAFLNPSGTIAAVVLNPDRTECRVTLMCGNQSFSGDLPARSVTTFVWSNLARGPVEVWTTTADRTKLLEKQMPVR